MRFSNRITLNFYICGFTYNRSQRTIATTDTGLGFRGGGIREGFLELRLGP